MPEVEFTASRCRRVLDTEIHLCKFFLQKEDKDLTSGRIEGALNTLKEKEELLRKSFEKILLSCKDTDILDTEDRAYKQVLEEAITMEATLSNRLKHLKNLENQNIVTVPSVMSRSSCPTLTGPSNTETSVRYDQGQYWVRLPWKFLHPHLPHNFDRALGQLGV